VLKNPWNDIAWLNFFDVGYEMGLFSDMCNIIDYVRQHFDAHNDVLTLHHAICLNKLGKYDAAKRELDDYLLQYPDDSEAKLILQDVEKMRVQNNQPLGSM